MITCLVVVDLLKLALVLSVHRPIHLSELSSQSLAPLNSICGWCWNIGRPLFLLDSMSILEYHPQKSKPGAIPVFIQKLATQESSGNFCANLYVLDCCLDRVTSHNIIYIPVKWMCLENRIPLNPYAENHPFSPWNGHLMGRDHSFLQNTFQRPTKQPWNSHWWVYHGTPQFHTQMVGLILHKNAQRCTFSGYVFEKCQAT